MYLHKRLKTLDDVFPDAYANKGGIFAALQSLNVPWKNDNIAKNLDLEFYGNVAGQRPISPLVRKIMQGDTLSDEEIARLAQIIYTLNNVTWTKEYATLSAQYNPIENYSMTEEMSDDERVTQYGRKDTRTNNLSHTKTGTETLAIDDTTERTDDLDHARTGTETLTHNVTDERTDDLERSTTGTETTVVDGQEVTTPATTTATSVYGFNSAAASPAGSQTQSGTNTVDTDTTTTLTHNVTEANTGTVTDVKTGTETTQYNTTDSDTGTQTTTRDGTETTTHNTTEADTGTQMNQASGTDTETRNYTLTRSGNIGVTTSQQMLQSERDLWLWSYFQDVVFPSVVKVLALQIY